MKSYQPYDDGTLVRLLKKGEDGAFTELYNRYWDKIFYTAGRKLGSLHEAEEIVQDIFTDLWHRRAELEIKTTFNAYLAGALKYKVIDARNRRHKTRSLEPGAFLSSVPDHSTEQYLSFEALKDQLAELVAALPERCQLAFRLSREAGLSQKEIAEQMQISEKAVEGNISRATTTLKLGLKNFLSLFL